MTPGVSYRATEEQRLDQHVGCIAGFLHLFDRDNVLAWRRHATCSTTGSTSPSERSEASSASLLKESHPQPSSPESPDEAESPPRRSLPLPLPVFEAKDGARITGRVRDAPRLSLDSRVVVDAKGKLCPREIRTAVSVPPADQSDASYATEEQLRSPSIVVRLIGVDALPSAGGLSVAERVPAELRRSASESRVRRDPSYYVDAGSFHKPPPPKAVPFSIKELFETVNVSQFSDAKKLEPTPRMNSLPPLLRKSFFDAEDLFPEPKQLGMHYGDIENRLRMRGIDEPAKDFETLKQILEALQLKGPLRSKPSDHGATGRRIRIYDNQGPIPGGAPIVIMKPTSKPPRWPSSETQRPRSGVARRSAPPVHREQVASVDHSIRGGNERSNRAPRAPESPISPVHRRASNAAARSPLSQRGMPNVSSTKSNPKRAGPDPLAVGSPRRRRPTANASPMERVHPLAEDDASTTVSERSISASSRLDFERSGRSLLERCDKLLQSIAAFTGAEQDTAADQQPSPVSVLDSPSYLGEDGPPSPLPKRSVDFKDQLADDWEEEPWSTYEVRELGGSVVMDPDFAYVRDVLRASERYGDASDAAYAALGNGRCHRRGGPAGDPSKTARLHRRLVFDAVAEILDRKRHVSPWDVFARGDGGEGEKALPRVWAEFQRVREQVAAADDHEGAACGAVRNDIAAARPDGWVRPAAEMSDVALQIERLIFKNLVAETIRDLGAREPLPLLHRRKLVF